MRLLKKILPKDGVGWGMLASAVVLIAVGVGYLLLIFHYPSDGGSDGMGGALAILCIGVGLWMVPGAFVKHDGGPYETWGNEDA